MTKLTDIEGIGEVYAERLSKAGINTPEKLVQSTATRQRLSKLANSTGIPEQKLLTWAARGKRIRTTARGRGASRRRRARRTASEPTGTGGGRPRGSIR